MPTKRKKTRLEDPSSVAELEDIKLAATASIRVCLESIQGDYDPDDLQDNGEGTDLGLLAVHADNLSAAYQEWQHAQAALWSKPEWAEARCLARKAKAEDEAEDDAEEAKIVALLTEIEQAYPEAEAEDEAEPAPTSNVIPFPGGNDAA